MNRIQCLFLLGGGSLISGLCLLLLPGTPLHAQDETPDYVGARECSSCHREIARLHDDSRHVLTLSDDEDAILGDFEQGEEARLVQFPDEDAPRAFAADDIEFTIGTGRFVQRYLYEVDNNDYRVLPAEWDVTTGTWRRLELAESWDDPVYDWETSCAYCHVTGFDVERARWEDDGVQCEACHGPGENHVELASDAGRRPSEDELAEIRAAINPAVDPQTCGQCHSRGVSPDGLLFPANYTPGAPLTDFFALTALEQTDHWWPSGHARFMNMQYNEWINSGHANALTVLRESGEADDSCLSCHSADYAYRQRLADAVDAGRREGAAPPPVTLADAQFGITCTSCHNPHSEAGLNANLVEESYALCTSCHSNAGVEQGIHHPVREMWEGTAIIDGIVPEIGIHFVTEGGPTCVTCHAATVTVEAGSRVSHALQPVLPGAALGIEALQDNCSGCHGEQAAPELLQALIDDIQTNTQMRLDRARAAITPTTPDWVTQALDFVEGDGSLGIHNYAYSDAVLDAVDAQLGLLPAPGQ